MIIEMWSGTSFGEKWREANAVWKGGAEIIKKHPAVLDCRVFREVGGGNNHKIFAMWMFESQDKRSEFWKSPPEGLREPDKSGTYDHQSVETRIYSEV